MRVSGLAITLALVLMAAPARAATVSATGGVAQFTAAPGEANRVTAGVTATSFTPALFASPYDVIVRDTGAPLTAGAGCTALDAHAARCDLLASVSIDTADADDSVMIAGIKAKIASGPGADHVVTPDYLPSEVDAGDGDDVLAGGGILDGGAGNDTLTGASDMRGGPGADVLIGRAGQNATSDGGDGDDRISGGGTQFGGAGDDTLTGGADLDALYGGPGRDALSAGAGDDRLDGDGARNQDAPETAPPGDDRLDGGTGTDTLAHPGRREGITVDLAAGIAGTGPEQDVLVSIENASGGPGPDRLRGTSGPNALDGGGGKDVLDGRGGDDDLLDGRDHAADRLHGGSGDDTLHGRWRDTLTCGPGTDSAADHRNTTTVDISCERLRFGGGLWNAAVRLSPTSVRAPVRCRLTCSGTLEVRARGASLGRAQFARRRAGSLVVRLRRRHGIVELRARFFTDLDTVRLRL